MSPVRRFRLALVGLLTLLFVNVGLVAWVVVNAPGGVLGLSTVTAVALLVAAMALGGFAMAAVLFSTSRQLQRLASTDPLTGLRFLDYLEGHLTAELERARRYGRELSFLMTDVDDLREVNTKVGHLAGSHLLQAIAGAIRDGARGDTTIARYGGDEFVILLPEAGHQEARVFAERIRERVAELRVRTGRGRVQATISIGISTAPACGTTQEELIDAADRALFWAKAKGKNCVAHLRDVPPRVALEARGDYPRLDTPMTPLPALDFSRRDEGGKNT